MAAASTHAFAVPVYGESPYLDTCLASLRAQTVAARIVLCAPCRNPFLESVARRHGAEVRVAPPYTAGIATDWNRALTVPDAELVTIAHQDDVYAPGYLAGALAAFGRWPDATLLFTNHSEYGPDGPRSPGRNVVVKRLICAGAFAGKSTLRSISARQRLLRLGNPVCCPSVTFNRRLVPDFRFSEAWRMNLDWDAWWRLASRPGRFIYLREPLVSHRVHPGSETSACLRDDRREDEDHRMFRRLWPAWVVRPLHSLYRGAYAGNRT